MKEQFVTYEIALKLKELGFDEDCLAVFYQGKFMNGHIEPHVWNLVNSIKTNSDCNSLDIVTAPLWQQVIDWFREVKNIIVEVWYDNTQDDGFPWLYEIYIDNKEHQHDGSYYDSFYEVREQAILKAFELIKK